MIPFKIIYFKVKIKRKNGRFKMKKTHTALQLYSVREECAKDFEGTIKEISQIGYEGVEFAGYHGKTAKEIKKLLEKYNLKVAGSHIPLNSLLKDEFERTVEFNSIIGNKYLIIPSLPEEYTNTKEDWLRAVELINEISLRLKPYGMKVGYHNHAVEFQKIDDEIPWYMFFDRADKDVIMQIDVGNALNGNGDPIYALKKYKERAITIHLKEYPFSARAIGEGLVNWKEIFDICESSGKTEWYIVEYENKNFPIMDILKLCLENIIKIKG
jgi:sugar phosphate isomerase/epimerase